MKQRILVAHGLKKEIMSQTGATHQTVRNALCGISNSILSAKIRRLAIELGGEYESEVK